ncbi:MAG: glycoside hydrolase family 5 protein [Muribaculaceae bacterium]|nr:glycoside hydrolase family 5 protein [Muribaculaceae bacterium]
MKKIVLSLLLALAPALAATAETYDGCFSTSGTRLIDARGNDFVMRGANYSWCWQKGREKTVVPAARRIGCNTLRIQLGTGRRFSKPTEAQLENLIRLCEENSLIAVFNTHDATGSDSYADLEESVRFWVEMKEVFGRHKATTIINIANEWFGSMNNAEAWADGYRRAIAMMREAGIENTLMVDDAGWGQWPKSIFDKAADVADADPLNNLVFSIHMYDVAAKNHSTVKKNIDNALATGYPVVIGEFAYQHGGKTVAWQSILDYTAEKEVGYLVWSWTGNSGGVEDCDMFGGYDESVFKPNGTNTVLGRNGIRDTATVCSIYTDSSGISDVAADTPEGIDFSKPYEAYTLTGLKVRDMCPGTVYVVRQGAYCAKVIY